MENCKNSGYEISDHFGAFTEMVSIGSNAKTKNFIKLSLQGCSAVTNRKGGYFEH